MKFLSSIISLCLFSAIYSQDTLIYKKTADKAENTITYTIDRTPSLYKIQSVSKNQVIDMQGSVPYQLISFSCKTIKNGDVYSCTLKDGHLIVEGEYKGEKVHKDYPLKHGIWVQEFDFGLLPLLTSNDKSLNFEILHPKTFELYKMVAKKQKIEPLSLEGVTYEAQQVQVSLQGFKSMFWKAHLWYDTKTHNLLMYKANEGPHTPTYTTSLASKPIQIN